LFKIIPLAKFVLCSAYFDKYKNSFLFNKYAIIEILFFLNKNREKKILKALDEIP